MDVGLFELGRKRCKTCGSWFHDACMFCPPTPEVERLASYDIAFARAFDEHVIRQRCLAIQEEWDDETRNIRSWCREKEWAPPACVAAVEPDEPSRYDELADLGEALRWAASHRRQRRKLMPLWVMSER